MKNQSEKDEKNKTMSEPLFKTVACFTDIHFGLKHNSKLHNQDCIDFIHWFIAEAKSRNAETCIFMGDYHHHRSSINVSTLKYIIESIKLLSDNFETVYMITGNHDLFYREKRDVHSLAVGNEYKNVVIVDEMFIHGDVAIVPWLVEEEWKTVKKIKSKYMFGHFEIPGFKMNALIEMPDHGEIQKSHFAHQEYVFSGHFHKRQSQGNVHYIGNPFGHNYSDSGDGDRGAMFLEWGKTPEYVNWNDGPKYISCTLSTLLNNIEELLLPKTHIKVILDTDISYEEANYIRETFTENYDIRELKLMHDHNASEEFEFDGEITFQSVDQIVLEQISNIESNSFSSAKLLDIYNKL